jgi:tRNA(adenine34) deaminase
MHYLDEGLRPAGEGDTAQTTYVCLHGDQTWSYLYRHMIPVFLASGARVVVPDLIGFGKSDKPKKETAHTFSWHRRVLLEWVECLDLRNVVLVVQGWGGTVGLTLPMVAPERYTGVLVMNTLLATGDQPWPPALLNWREQVGNVGCFKQTWLVPEGSPRMDAAVCTAYSAPYPDRGHCAVLRAWRALTPMHPRDDGAAVSREAQTFWRVNWAGRAAMAIGQQDATMGEDVMLRLHAQLRRCETPLHLPHAGHHLPEWGRDIAARWVSGWAQNQLLVDGILAG